jgi:integrase
MFLFKKKNGYYYVVYNDENRKRRFLSTKTKYKREANEFFSNIREEIKRRQKQEIISISLEQFRFKTLKRCELTHSAKSCKCYRTSFNYFLKYFGNLQLNEISKSKMQDYLESRFKETSIYAARKDLINLKAAFNIAVEDKHILINPCKGIKQFKIPEKQPLFISKAEYETLCNTIDDKEFKDFVIIAANTGMRLMELFTLRWEQVNLVDRIILLDNHEHITKSKRIRSIPMNDTVYDVLKNRFQAHSDFIVFNYFTTSTDSKISHKFKMYVLKAGINPKYHFHTLRHTFASWLIQSGVNIYLVSKLLGHANIKTTEIYAHLRQEDLQRAVNIL